MKFIGVIAVLSFLVVGSVSAHAAELGLDCPEDNTYTPSPPQMLNRNVTPYTYVPIPRTSVPIPMPPLDRYPPRPVNVTRLNPYTGISNGPYVTTGGMGRVTSIPYVTKPDIGQCATHSTAISMRSGDNGNSGPGVKFWLSTTPGGGFEAADPACRSDSENFANGPLIFTGISAEFTNLRPGFVTVCPLAAPGVTLYVNIETQNPAVYVFDDRRSGFYTQANQHQEEFGFNVDSACR